MRKFGSTLEIDMTSGTRKSEQLSQKQTQLLRHSMKLSPTCGGE